MKRRVSPWTIALVLVGVVVLNNVRVRYDALLDGARDRELAASQRAWQAQRARLLKSAQMLEQRLTTSNKLAERRARVSVSLPERSVTPPSGLPPVPDSAASDSGKKENRDTLATVTINDTAYAVPVRVAIAVDSLTIELAHADSLRAAADTVAKLIPVAVVAADSVITVATKKRHWLLRWFGKATTAICAAGGAFLGSLVGKEGAAAGAAGGVVVCAVAR